MYDGMVAPLGCMCRDDAGYVNPTPFDLSELCQTKIFEYCTDGTDCVETWW